MTRGGTALREEYDRAGFVVVDSRLDEETILEARKATGPLQPKRYHWNPDGKRVFEAWKTSQAVRDVVYAPGIMEAIGELVGTVSPIQTINFDKGTNQRLHADGVHFQTMPLGMIIGAWVALEDMDEDNGTLMYSPRSQRLGNLGWQALGLKKQIVDRQYDEYAKYESIIDEIAGENRVPVECKKGQAFIWGLDLFHGGWPIKDKARTRYSQVSHYAMEGFMFGWAPMFSDPESGDYYKKSMKTFSRLGVVGQAR